MSEFGSTIVDCLFYPEREKKKKYHRLNEMNNELLKAHKTQNSVLSSRASNNN